MLQGFTSWWNEPEQELLKLEFRRAFRFFWSWTGLALVAVQLGLIYSLAVLQIRLEMSGFLSIKFIYRFYRILSQVAENAIWIYLLFGKSYLRFRKEQREQLLMLPVSGRMIWPALLSTPLVWLTIVGALSLAYATVKMYLELSMGSSDEYLCLQYATIIAADLQNLTLCVCLTFFGSYLIVPRCSFSRFLWICLIAWFLSFVLRNAIDSFWVYQAPGFASVDAYVHQIWQRGIVTDLIVAVVWSAIAIIYLIRLRKPQFWQRMEEQLREREAA